MKYKGDFVIIAKDGWPLEQIIGHPVKNFFRRLFLGSHKRCRACLPTNYPVHSCRDNCSICGAGQAERGQ